MNEEGKDNLYIHMLNRIEDIGRAENMIRNLMKHEVFEHDTSKHNPWWHSEHEVESEKLERLRWDVRGFDEALSEIWEVLSSKEINDHRHT